MSEEIIVQVLRNGRLSGSGGRTDEVLGLPSIVGEYLWNTLSEAFGVLAPDVLAAACRWAFESEIHDPNVEWEATGPAITRSERVSNSQMGLALAEAFAQLGIGTKFV